VNRLAFVDIETTGTSYYSDRIIDIGVVIYEKDKKIQEFSSLINPHTSINPYVSMITGITQSDLAEAPEFGDIHNTLIELLKDTLFIAHNVRFDYGFIKRELEYLEKGFNMPHMCSALMSRRLYPQFKRHNLDAIIKRFDISVSQRHRALPDAQAIGYFYEKSKQALGKKNVEMVMQSLLRSPKYPRYISKSMIQNLPDSPGVYIMYGKDDEVLYIGKSVNVRDRVISHFYQDIKSTKELAIKNQTRFIEGIATAGELEALVTESRLIKKLSPIYNRALRIKKTNWYIQGFTDYNKYTELRLGSIRSSNFNKLKNILFVSGSKSSAKNTLESKVREYMLCPKLCGLEKTHKACFNSQIGKCLGACKGLEPPASYNIRVQKAFADTSYPVWPFAGPVVICELNQKTQKHTYHLIHNWHLIDSAQYIDELNINKNFTKSDLDTQRIIQKFILKQPSDRIINFAN